MAAVKVKKGALKKHALVYVLLYPWNPVPVLKASSNVSMSSTLPISACLWSWLPYHLIITTSCLMVVPRPKIYL